MAVTLNSTALFFLLNSEDGPVGQFMRFRAEEVRERAIANADGLVVQPRTGNLRDNIQRQGAFVDGEDAAQTVFTTAESSWGGRPFFYPAFLDQNGFPWLSDALRDVMAI